MSSSLTGLKPAVMCTEPKLLADWFSMNATAPEHVVSSVLVVVFSDQSSCRRAEGSVHTEDPWDASSAHRIHILAHLSLIQAWQFSEGSPCQHSCLSMLCLKNSEWLWERGHEWRWWSGWVRFSGTLWLYDKQRQGGDGRHGESVRQKDMNKQTDE